MRQIRFMGKNKAMEILSKTEDSIYTKLLANSLVGEKLNKQEVSDLLDLGLKLDTEQKEMKEKVDQIKKICINYAKKHKVIELLGHESKAKVSPKNTQVVKIMEFLKLLKKLGKMKMVSTTLKVLNSEAKKYVPEDDLLKISDVTKNEYASISIKKKK